MDAAGNGPLGSYPGGMQLSRHGVLRYGDDPVYAVLSASWSLAAGFAAATGCDGNGNDGCGSYAIDALTPRSVPNDDVITTS